MKNIFSILLILLITSCGLYRKTDLREVPVNVDDRAAKNIAEGKGFRFGDVGKRGSGSFEFASSNEMWRASINLLDFAPFSNVDYSGGIIITDWYSDSQSSEDSLKITIRFLSNEIQSNSIKIIVHNKKCKTNENCKISEIDSQIKMELQKSILANAAKLEKELKKSKK